MTPRKIEPSAIVPLPQYAGERAERRKRIAELKKNRRLEVGPFATFYFESYDTMLHQVHEMLFIEKGGAAQLPDVTFNANGSLAPIRETMLLTGVIWHAIPGLDIYGYAGEEVQDRTFGFTPLGTNNSVGIGNPVFNNSGCGTEFSLVCSNNVHLVRQIAGGFWETIYKGPFGKLSGGLTYSFTQKYGFPGIGVAGNGIPGIPGTGGVPKRDENTFFTSLRYYPF